jgi:flagellar protein FlaJ
MSIEITNNLKKERRILEHIMSLDANIGVLRGDEKQFVETAIHSLFEQFTIINNSTKDIITSLAFEKKDELLPQSGKKEKVVVTGQIVTIKKTDKARLITELKISQEVLEKLKKSRSHTMKKVQEKPMKFISFASSLFLNKSIQLSKSDFFSSLKKSIKKANMNILISSYISVMILSTILTLIFAIIIALLLSFLSLNYPVGAIFPQIAVSTKDIGINLLKNLGFALLAPIIVFFLFYLSPGSQASSIQRKIDNEMPFAIIHMSAIAGSGVEPVKVFNIIASSAEYPAVSSEMKKVMNLINLYGYDLVNALKEAAKLTSSEKFASLLTGIANITISGGDLKEYLEKKAADTLLDYKLKKKSEAQAAETSMDLYVSVLIAAPLILMVMLVIMGAVPGLGFKGISIVSLSYIIVLAIALLNVAFLFFLKMKRQG